MFKKYFRERKIKKLQEKKKELEMLKKINRITNVDINDSNEKMKRKKEITDCIELLIKLDNVVSKMNEQQLKNTSLMIKKYFYNYKITENVESKRCYSLLYKLNKKIDNLLFDEYKNEMDNNILDLDNIKYAIECGNKERLIIYKNYLISSINRLNDIEKLEAISLIKVIDRKLHPQDLEIIDVNEKKYTYLIKRKAS